jgi:hypothetical protein
VGGATVWTTGNADFRVVRGRRWRRRRRGWRGGAEDGVDATARIRVALVSFFCGRGFFPNVGQREAEPHGRRSHGSARFYVPRSVLLFILFSSREICQHYFWMMDLAVFIFLNWHMTIMG